MDSGAMAVRDAQISSHSGKRALLRALVEDVMERVPVRQAAIVA